MDSPDPRTHVLLIEDDEVDARVVKRMFSELPEVRSLTHRDSLSAGIQQIKEQSDIDLILLDLGLPESRGLPTLDKLREEVTDVPVVVLTSADDWQLGVDAVQHGAQDYLVKGKVDADLMARAIAYAIKRHRMQCEMQRLLDELKRSNQELDRFAHVVAHDLNAPLRWVTSFCQLLQEEYLGKLDSTADEYFANITTGTDRMRKLINDLLLYSRVHTEDTPDAPVDFSRVFDAAVANLKTVIGETSATVTQDDLPSLDANETQMLQLLQNLIGNAIKYCSDQPPRVHVAAEQQEGGWQFSIRDNGIGIEPQYYQRIFEVFKRLHGGDEYEGTGIGLAICKKVVEVHGGRIWVESEPGNGSIFYFTLPAETKLT